MPGDLSTVHINRALESMSVLLMNEDNQYLLQKVCARRPVDVVSDNFFRYGREAGRRSPTGGTGASARNLVSVTGAGSPAPVVDTSISFGTYNAQRYSLRDLVTDKELLNQDQPLNLLQDTAKILRQRILNDAEYVCVSVIGNAGNYPSANKATLTTGANGTSWKKASAAGTGSNPLNDIRTARITVEKIIQREVNTLAMSATTRYHLADHNQLSGILQYTDSLYLQGDGIPPALRGLEIVAGKAVGDTAAEGAAFSGDYLFQDWTDGTNKDIAIACYVPPEKTIGPRGFASFIWFDCPDETTRQRGVSLRAYRDDASRGWWVEAAITFDVQPGIVDSNSKITGAYQICRTTV